jgi:ubiquinone/menaquinone biosynthesis C-methylase UbiE
MLDRYIAIDPHKLRLRPDSRVLDVGCGTGRHLLEMSRFPGDFVGLDMDKQELLRMRFWLDIWRNNGPLAASIHMVQGDGERLPFTDEFFDHVICTETLEHVPDDRSILRELMRVLQPGGVLVISVPDEYSERLLWRFSRRYRTHPGGHVRIYRRTQIARMMQEGGAPPYAKDYRHSLESFRWLVHSTIDSEWGQLGYLSRSIRWLLDTPSHRNWRSLAFADAALNRILPKSVVLYGEKQVPA